MGRKSPPSPKSPLKKLLMMPPMMPILSVSRLINTIIDATIIRSRITSSRILSPKRQAAPSFWWFLFSLPFPFLLFPFRHCSLPLLFSQTAILQWFWQFFSYFSVPPKLSPHLFPYPSDKNFPIHNFITKFLCTQIYLGFCKNQGILFF